jgi:hypothetical protein
MDYKIAKALSSSKLTPISIDLTKLQPTGINFYQLLTKIRKPNRKEE